MQWFPIFYLQYKPNQTHRFNASYNRRIQRPDFWSLNPFRFYKGANGYMEGNPFLKPAYAHNVEFTYSYKNKLFTKPYFSVVFNHFDKLSLPLFKNEGIAEVYHNFFDQYEYGLNEMYNFSPYDWWQSNNQIGFYRQYFRKRRDFPYDVDFLSKWVGVLISQNHFTLNKAKTYFAEMSFAYQSPKNKAGVSLSALQYLNLGFSAMFFKRKLLVNLLVQDIFNTLKSKTNSRVGNLLLKENTRGDSRYVSLAISYKFGNPNKRNIKPRRKRTFKNGRIDVFKD